MTRLEGAGGEAPRGRQGGDRAYVTRNYDPVSGTRHERGLEATQGCRSRELPEAPWPQRACRWG